MTSRLDESPQTWTRWKSAVKIHSASRKLRYDSTSVGQNLGFPTHIFIDEHGNTSTGATRTTTITEATTARTITSVSTTTTKNQQQEQSSLQASWDYVAQNARSIGRGHVPYLSVQMTSSILVRAWKEARVNHLNLVDSICRYNRTQTIFFFFLMLRFEWRCGHTKPHIILYVAQFRMHDSTRRLMTCYTDHICNCKHDVCMCTTTTDVEHIQSKGEQQLVALRFRHITFGVLSFSSYLWNYY